METPKEGPNRRRFFEIVTGGLAAAAGLAKDAKANLPPSVPNNPDDLPRKGIPLKGDGKPEPGDQERLHLDPTRLEHLEQAPSKDDLERDIRRGPQ